MIGHIPFYWSVTNRSTCRRTPDFKVPYHVSSTEMVILHNHNQIYEQFQVKSSKVQGGHTLSQSKYLSWEVPSSLIV